jgi:3'(2'), 5'-bisphosphate nucleotidase
MKTQIKAQPADWLPGIIEIARSAGNAIMQVYAGEIEIQRKDDNSPLTKADMAAHHIIESGLQRLSPELPVLSEESVTIPYEVRSKWRRYWLVDPLDGTREFIKRNDEFTVNIALIDDGNPVMGIVYAPAKELLYFASQGNGAFKQAGTQDKSAIRARILDPERVTIAGSRSHSDARVKSLLSNITGKLSAPELIPMGSSLKMCMVAEGLADLYPRLGLTSEWDTAAAQCILEEAGGRLIDTSGNPFIYNTKESLLNAEFFACGVTPYAWQQYL